MCSNYLFTLLSSGQTGVERGVCLAAQALGVAIGGVMPANGRDELGPVPEEIAARLARCAQDGPRRAREANIELAGAVVIVVPEARRAVSVTGMKQVMVSARARQLPLFVCDRHSDLAAIASSVLAALQARGESAIYVTGPRGTRWADGEALGRAVARAIVVAAASAPADESSHA